MINIKKVKAPVIKDITDNFRKSVKIDSTGKKIVYANEKIRVDPT